MKIGLYEDLRVRRGLVGVRLPSDHDAETWRWLHAYCEQGRERILRSGGCPAYSLSLKVPTDPGETKREGAPLPVVMAPFNTSAPAQPRVAGRRSPNQAAVDLQEARSQLDIAAEAVVRTIERMILGKQCLDDGTPVFGLTNHPDRVVKPALDWSPSGRKESLECIRSACQELPRATVFYNTRCFGLDWSDADVTTVATRIREAANGNAYFSTQLREGEAVAVGRRPVRPRVRQTEQDGGDYILPTERGSVRPLNAAEERSSVSCLYPRDVPVLFQALPPTILERGLSDPPRTEVMAVAGPWLPRENGVIHFGPSAA